MAVSEPDQHELYQRIEETIGKKPAETFMNLVSHVPWTDVATKRDLDALRAEFHEALRGQLLAFAAIVAAINGVFAALKLS